MSQTIIFDLPSKGLVYPLDNPLSTGKMELRYGKAADEDILANVSYIKNRTVFYKLIDALKVDKEINLNEMIMPDFNAAVIASRVAMYGDEYEPTIICPECGSKKKMTIDVDMKHFVELDESVLFEKNKNIFEYETKNGTKLKFKLLTVEGDQSLNKFRISSQAAGRTFNEAIQGLRYTIIEVNGKIKPEEIMVYINEMTSVESKAFRKHIMSITPQAKIVSEYMCNNCGYSHQNMEVEIDTNFFWEIQDNI